MLEIKDLVGGYGSVQILNGASLKVERGQIVALLGGNGTGKSTLLKATSGLLKPWSGSITFDGERIDGLRPDAIVRRGLVQVTQGKEAFPGMTVEENLNSAPMWCMTAPRGRLHSSACTHTSRSSRRSETSFPERSRAGNCKWCASGAG